jgi:hypothetical protein
MGTVHKFKTADPGLRERGETQMIGLAQPAQQPGHLLDR